MEFPQDVERKQIMMGNLLTLISSSAYMENEYIGFNATRDYISKECFLCEREFEDLEHKRAFNLEGPQDIPSNIFMGAWCEDCFQEFDLFSRTINNVN